MIFLEEDTGRRQQRQAHDPPWWGSPAGNHRRDGRMILLDEDPRPSQACLGGGRGVQLSDLDHFAYHDNGQARHTVEQKSFPLLPA